MEQARGSRPGGRRSHLRGVRARPPLRPALRHLGVPGLRRPLRGTPRLQRGCRRHPPARPAPRRRAGLHPVRLEQRWLDLGGLRALPRRGGGPLRRLGRQPGHDWSVRVEDARIENTWPGIGNLRRITVTGRDGNGDWGGRVRSLDPRRRPRSGCSSAATPSAPRSDCAPPGLRSWSSSAPSRPLRTSGPGRRQTPRRAADGTLGRENAMRALWSRPCRRARRCAAGRPCGDRGPTDLRGREGHHRRHHRTGHARGHLQAGRDRRARRRRRHLRPRRQRPDLRQQRVRPVVRRSRRRPALRRRSTGWATTPPAPSCSATCSTEARATTARGRLRQAQGRGTPAP